MTDLTLIIPCKGDDCRKLRLEEAPCPTIVIREHLYGDAIKCGLQRATTPWVATMDADGQHRVSDVEQLYQELDRDPDIAMVVGTRDRKAIGPRDLSSRFLNLAASIMAGRHVPDFGSGLRIMNREIALGYLESLPAGFDFNAALTMAFLMNGHEVLWSGVEARQRAHGKSHVRLLDGVKTLISLTKDYDRR